VELLKRELMKKEAETYPVQVITSGWDETISQTVMKKRKGNWTSV